MTATAPAGEVRPEVVTAGRFQAGKSAAGALVPGETGRRIDVGHKP